MNNSVKVKRLTENAMLLSLVGVVFLIDRQLGYFFQDILLLIIPICVVLSWMKNGKRNACLLSISIFILCSILGNLKSFIYLPAFVLSGLCIGANLEKSAPEALKISVLAFVICEVIITFILAPILGIQEFFNEQIRYLMYVFGVTYVGFLEGVIVFMLSVILLKRFKIYQIKTPILNVDKMWKSRCLYAVFLFFSTFILWCFWKNRVLVAVFGTLSSLCLCELLCVFFVKAVSVKSAKKL